MQLKRVATLRQLEKSRLVFDVSLYCKEKQNTEKKNHIVEYDCFIEND